MAGWPSQALRRSNTIPQPTADLKLPDRGHSDIYRISRSTGMRGSKKATQRKMILKATRSATIRLYATIN